MGLQPIPFSHSGTCPQFSVAIAAKTPLNPKNPLLSTRMADFLALPDEMSTEAYLWVVFRPFLWRRNLFAILLNIVVDEKARPDIVRLTMARNHFIP